MMTTSTITALDEISRRLLELLPWLVGETDAALYADAVAGATPEEIIARHGYSEWYIQLSLARAERYLLSCFSVDNLRAHMSEWLDRWETKLEMQIESSKACILAQRDAEELSPIEELPETPFTPLKSLGLATRSYNVLRQQLSVRSVEQLCTLTRAEILRARGAGVGTLADVQRVMARDGWQLADG